MNNPQTVAITLSPKCSDEQPIRRLRFSTMRVAASMLFPPPVMRVAVLQSSGIGESQYHRR
jgi:hypothetical protein